MSLDCPVGSDASAILRLVQGTMMLRSISHIVGHNVHEIHIRLNCLEVNIFRRCSTRQCQESVLSEGLTKILHQLGEIVGILR